MGHVYTKIAEPCLKMIYEANILKNSTRHRRTRRGQRGDCPPPHPPPPPIFIGPQIRARVTKNSGSLLSEKKRLHVFNAVCHIVSPMFLLEC